MLFYYPAIQLQVAVPFLEYYDKVAEHCHVQMSSGFHVKETGHYSVEGDDFQLVKPVLTMKVESYL